MIGSLCVSSVVVAIEGGGGADALEGVVTAEGVGVDSREAGNDRSSGTDTVGWPVDWSEVFT